MIGALTNLTSLVQRYQYFGFSSFTNNDTENLQLVISSLYIQHKVICELYGRTGHSTDDRIIYELKFQPLNLMIKMNQLNTLLVN